MTRSTYDAETGYRSYPGETRAFWGPEIETTTAFDEVRIKCMPDGFVIGDVDVYNSGVRVSQIHGQYVHGAVAAVNRYRYHRDDEEVMLVRRRIREGTCARRFHSFEDYFQPEVILTPEELHEANFLLDLLHPFHGDDRDLFFEHLTKNLEHFAASPGSLQRFIFPGIVEGASRRYYKREDSPSAPDTNHAAESSIRLLGWTPDVPYGGNYLHAIDVLDAPEAVSVSAPQRVYHRRKDATAAIVGLARAWHRYWRELPSDFQNNPVRRTLRDHAEHAIGRMWADKPFDSAIDVFHEGDSGARERGARDAEDWMLGNMEFWAHRWNFAALALALGEGSNRSLLQSQLDDYTFCHLKLDGSIGDRLSNGADGITEAMWDAYQDTHYPAAVNHGVDTLAVETLTIIVHQGTTETAQLPATGGLAPLAFALTTTETWASIDEATGEITVSPDAAVAAQNYNLTAQVTDDLGTVVNASVTVTVQAPPSD